MRPHERAACLWTPMPARGDTHSARMPAVAGAAAGLVGMGFVGVGLWAHRDVRRTLAQERIAALGGGRDGVVSSAAAARAMAELIRRNTLDATGGRTYAETAAYVGPDGEPTSDAALALRDERTGQPLENPDHELWIQSTTLQSALMQAYIAFRLSELTVALGGAFVALGVGLAAAARPVRSSPRRGRPLPLRR
jgi:hypothetical protein